MLFGTGLLSLHTGIHIMVRSLILEWVALPAIFFPFFTNYREDWLYKTNQWRKHFNLDRKKIWFLVRLCTIVNNVRFCFSSMRTDPITIHFFVTILCVHKRNQWYADNSLGQGHTKWVDNFQSQRVPQFLVIMEEKYNKRRQPSE